MNALCGRLQKQLLTKEYGSQTAPKSLDAKSESFAVADKFAKARQCLRNILPDRKLRRDSRRELLHLLQNYFG
jgi:hypothetical protein